jgi:hypothetical protein
VTRPFCAFGAVLWLVRISVGRLRQRLRARTLSVMSELSPQDFDRRLIDALVASRSGSGKEVALLPPLVRDDSLDEVRDVGSWVVEWWGVVE